MWKPITIKPNDQSLKGEIIRITKHKHTSYIILYVGRSHIFVEKEKTGGELAIENALSKFEILEESRMKDKGFGLNPSSLEALKQLDN